MGPLDKELRIIEGIVLGPTLPKIFTAAFVKNKPRQQYYIGVVGIGTFCVAGLRGLLKEHSSIA